MGINGFRTCVPRRQKPCNANHGINCGCPNLDSCTEMFKDIVYWLEQNKYDIVVIVVTSTYHFSHIELGCG